MKKSITGALLAFSMIGFACDNCNVYLNISPNDYRNSIGIYLRQRMMFGSYNYFGEMTATRHSGHGNDIAFWGQDVYETYQTAELRGSYYFREKWKTTVNVPFIQNRQTIGDYRRYTVNGIGDPTLLQSYQLLNTKKDTSKKSFTNRLMIGAGIKFPLGKTDLTYESGTPNLDLQPGTGSWDVLTYLTYSAKLKFMGINANVNLRKNGQDENLYRYGFTTNGTINLFADLQIKKVTIRFTTGGYVEHAAMDETYSAYYQHAEKHNDTGGTVWFANGGLQVFTAKFALFGEYQQVVKSELNGYTQLLTRNKINLGLTYYF